MSDNSLWYVTEQSERIAALRKIEGDQYPVTPQTSGQEDFDVYVEGEEHVGRYLLVTRSGDYYYLTAFDDLEVAMDRGERYIDNDIYAEVPVVIIDLDNDDGTRRYPRISVDWS